MNMLKCGYASVLDAVSAAGDVQHAWADAALKTGIVVLRNGKKVDLLPSHFEEMERRFPGRGPHSWDELEAYGREILGK